ncbi:4'-phosphopantetheinyl transferase family protein [Streptomyces sp. NPDC053493]|uniref:4'-phosphopantetheinyl transferase family protein n=1 Tax=Streptomyces sp. NPDC053493 TaxID=3365705 RepID=UPI0037D1A4AA
MRRPLRQGGPGGGWDEVCALVAGDGACVVYAEVDDWVPADLGAASLAEDLGADHARLERMPASRNRDRFVAARLFLKSAAGAVLGAGPRELELAYKPGGRPYLRGIDQLDVGLSHTEGLLVVGLTRFGRIGVDTEPADRRMLELGTEAMACTPHELEALERVPAERRDRELVRLWTLKEAYSKAIGQGLRFRFTEFGFGPEDARVRMLRPDGTPGAGDEWSFHSWLVEDAYTVSAAVHDPDFGELRLTDPGSSAS